MYPNNNILYYSRSANLWRMSVLTESGVCMLKVSRTQALHLIENDVSFVIED